MLAPSVLVFFFGRGGGKYEYTYDGDRKNIANSSRRVCLRLLNGKIEKSGNSCIHPHGKLIFSARHCALPVMLLMLLPLLAGVYYNPSGRRSSVPYGTRAGAVDRVHRRVPGSLRRTGRGRRDRVRKRSKGTHRQRSACVICVPAVFCWLFVFSWCCHFSVSSTGALAGRQCLFFFLRGPNNRHSATFLKLGFPSHCSRTTNLRAVVCV